MNAILRRVLVVGVLLAAVLPWLTPTAAVQAQDAAPEQSEPANDATDAADASAVSTSAVPTGNGQLSLPTGGVIAIIEIEGAIGFNQFQIESLQRRIDRAVNDGVDLIVFEFDTPGGVLITSIEITKLIRAVPVPTVAWINDRALSAGILLSSACNEIVMAPGSLTGDCGPIIPGREMANSERAKELAYLLAEFKLNAQSNYNGPTTSDYAMFHAMCALGIEVYQVRHKLTGEVRLVSKADYAVMVDGVSPIDAAQVGTGQSGSVLIDPESGDDVGRPELSVTQADMGQWELVKQVHNGTTFLTVNTQEALDIGLARAEVGTERELITLYGASRAQRYTETWSESLVGFLVHPIVRACLLLLAIAGLLLEYMSPGLILPGVVGLAALVTLIGAPFLIGLAQTWHLVLIVIGAGLVIYELFTMTTFGVLAVIGLLMFLAGLVLSGVQTAQNGLPAQGGEVVLASMSFIGAIVLTVPLLVIITRYFGSLPLFNKLILADDHGPAELHSTASSTWNQPGVIGSIRPGTIGTVSSTGLRPAGRIELDDELIDVTSVAGFIEPGTAVRVVEVQGNMISVEPADNT